MITDAPRITATALRQALATSAGVVVQDLADGTTFALPYGLTKLQALDESLVVVATNREAADMLAAHGGRHADAARALTVLRSWEVDMLDRQLAAYAAKADQ